MYSETSLIDALLCDIVLCTEKDFIYVVLAWIYLIIKIPALNLLWYLYLTLHKQQLVF